VRSETGADEQRRFVPLRQRGPRPQRGAPDGLDFVERALAAQDEQRDDARKVAVRDHRGQRMALREEFTRAPDQRPDSADVRHARFSILGRFGPRAERLGVDARFLTGQIHPITIEEIAPDILPEVRHLERGAHRVGHQEHRGVIAQTFPLPPPTVWEGIQNHRQHDAPHGVRAARAVVEQLLPSVVARHALVLLERAQQIMERPRIERAAAHRPRERPEDGVAGRRFAPSAREASRLIHQFMPARELLQRGRARLGRARVLVGDVVGAAAEGVDGREVVAQRLGHEAREHMEVLVVILGERTIGLRLCFEQDGGRVGGHDVPCFAHCTRRDSCASEQTELARLDGVEHMGVLDVDAVLARPARGAILRRRHLGRARDLEHTLD
jgi:hypothetical protein